MIFQTSSPASVSMRAMILLRSVPWRANTGFTWMWMVDVEMVEIRNIQHIIAAPAVGQVMFASPRGAFDLTVDPETKCSVLPLVHWPSGEWHIHRKVAASQAGPAGWFRGVWAWVALVGLWFSKSPHLR